jgi:leucyl/phenylalanyl-tRNA--protein transferase
MAIEPPLSVWQLPDPADADPDFDVVALGADLAPGTVLAAYRAGMFPMHVETGDLAWWSPDPRGILPLDVMRVPRSLKVSARRFDVTVDRCFTEVMRECADDRRDKGWITDEFIETYTELHRLGWAHSVEAWTPAGDLAGGLYGLEIGGLFAGESMFHRETDASKVALLGLVDRMRTAGGARVLDVQWRTDHLATLGAIEIPRARYLALLAVALDEPACLVG